MSTGLEQQLATELRGLARRYCDGEITKGEYRRSRRRLLESLDESPDAQFDADPANDVTLQQVNSKVSLWPFKGWTISIMAITSVVLLGVIVALMIRSW